MSSSISETSEEIDVGGVDDRISSLPTPLSGSVDDQGYDLIRHTSAEEEEDEANNYDEEEEDEEQSTDEDEEEVEDNVSSDETPIEDRAYLSHSKALKQLLEREGQENFLACWTIDDITGLLIQLAKHTHEERGLKLIAKNFRETSIEEIADCIEQCKKMNARASQERFHFKELMDAKKLEDGEGTSTMQKAEQFPTWKHFAKHVKMRKGIGDESPTVINKYLTHCAKTSTKITAKESNLPDYSKIYQHLAAMGQGYSLKGLQGMDAAIMLDIFEQMERDVESMPVELKNFLKKMFRDIQILPPDDFKLNDDVKAENAEDIMNPLDFPFDSCKFDVASLFAKMEENANKE